MIEVLYQMMKAPLTRASDVHARPLPDRIQAFQHLKVVQLCTVPNVWLGFGCCWCQRRADCQTVQLCSDKKAGTKKAGLRQNGTHLNLIGIVVSMGAQNIRWTCLGSKSGGQGPPMVEGGCGLTSSN